MIHTKTQSNGYILITTTIVLFSIGSLAALSILYFAISATKSNKTFERSNQSKGVANGCAELAIQRVASTPAYVGTTTSTIGLGSCSYTVSKPTATTSLIVASGTVSTVVRKVQVTMNTSPTITVTQWQEIP